MRGQIVQLALDEPELSPRELATRFTDTKIYFVSEASVSQVLVAALGDAHQHFAIAAGMLPRNETDPGRQMPPVLELRPIADSGDDCRGGLRADALDPGDALTIFVSAEDAINLPIERSNPVIEIAERS